jgi:hypothetical protein
MLVSMDRREQMRRLLARRERLGLTLRELSSESGVPAGTLGYWAWKLRGDDDRKAGRSRTPRREGFVELVASAEPATGDGRDRIEVVLGGGRRVIVPAGIDSSALARVVRALERC